MQSTDDVASLVGSLTIYQIFFATRHWPEFKKENDDDDDDAIEPHVLSLCILLLTCYCSTCHYHCNHEV